MTEPIRGASQISSDWLDAVLRRAGAIERGGVSELEVQAGEGSWSKHVKIAVRYEAGSTGELPRHLRLKLCDTIAFDGSEVEFYTRDFADLAAAPLVRCYDARRSADGRAYHLLLEDVSETHGDGWSIELAPEHVVPLAESVAALHAHRWSLDALAEVGASPPCAAALERYFAHVTRGLEPLLAIRGDDLPPGAATLLRELFAEHPRLMLERCRDRRGTCLVHGDLNPGNLLLPKTGASRVYLLDRQPFEWSLRVWLGVSDLAYLMASFWSPELRRRHEQALLRAYHDGLRRRGVHDYDWDALLADYRLCAVQSAYVAVEWCVLEGDRERMRWLWREQLRRALAAVDDLGCRALWSR